MNRSRIMPLIGSRAIIGGFLLLVFHLVAPVWVLAQEADAAGQTPPLHQQIDGLLNADSEGLPWVSVADAPLVRRLYLDLIGVPPSLAEMESYLADTDPDKYSKLVTQLLTRGEFIEHWVKQLDLVFMERRANTQIPQVEWEEFLRASLTQRQPFNQLCAAILSANGAPGPGRPAARFYLDRGGDMNLITRDVGRVFFGRDLQCAQCHDHPLFDAYYQADYQGIAAFFSGGYLVEVPAGDKKFQVYGEKSLVESPFESVFHKGEAHRSLPRIPLSTETLIPSIEPGSDYEIAPADGVAAKPKHSRRQQLAELATNGSSTAFNENWANRFWALLFGRGVIHPVDLIHADAEPLHPELLPLLGKSFASSGYDLRGLIRELVLTQRYKSGQSDPWEGTDPTKLREVVELADWEPLRTKREAAWEESKQKNKQLSDVTQQAKEALLAIEKERTAAFAALDQARAARIAANDAMAKATAEVGAAEKAIQDEQAKQAKFQAAVTATDAAKQLLPQDAEVIKALEVLTQRLTNSSTAVTNLTATLEEKKKGIVAAQAAVDASRNTWVTADQTAAAKIAQFAAADASYTEARNQEERARMLAGAQKRQLDFVSLMLSIRDTVRAQDGVAAELLAVQSKRDSAVSQQSAMTKLIQEMEVQLTQITQQRDQEGEQVRVYGERKVSLDGIRQKIVTATAALDQLPDNQVESIQVARAELNKRLAESDAALAQWQQEAKVAQEKLTAIEAKLVETKQAQKVQQEALVALNTELASLNASLDTLAQKQKASQGDTIRQLADLRFLRMYRGDYAKLVALTPEQLAWSLLTVMGFVERQVAARLADIDKATPLTPEQQQDSALIEQRKRDAFLKARQELQGNVNVFVTLYGAGAGQPQSDFFATADQALFANNGGVIYSWAGATGGNVSQQFLGTTDLPVAINKLYLAVLGRSATAEEVADVTAYVNQAPDQKGLLIQEVVWGLLSSAEFRFNH